MVLAIAIQLCRQRNQFSICSKVFSQSTMMNDLSKPTSCTSRALELAPLTHYQVDPMTDSKIDICPTDRIFCRIVKREKIDDFLYEDDILVVFADHKPRAPIHLLIVPKAHLDSFLDLDGPKLTLDIVLITQLSIRKLNLSSV
jgi:Scavenger mRNA decapping enzyme C-term binding